MQINAAARLRPMLLAATAATSADDRLVGLVVLTGVRGFLALHARGVCCGAARAHASLQLSRC
tara:strand:+ start:947 stop:1135 length:189 start_codon:yes stop_codon:yes gene_type:complete